MLYEIMNKIKQSGSINSSEIVELIGKFEDINQQQATEKEQIKYMNFGLEALSETVDRHKEGQFRAIQEMPLISS